jgi:hypothetical protein
LNKNQREQRNHRCCAVRLALRVRFEGTPADFPREIILILCKCRDFFKRLLSDIDEGGVVRSSGYVKRTGPIGLEERYCHATIVHLHPLPARWRTQRLWLPQALMLYCGLHLGPAFPSFHLHSQLQPVEPSSILRGPRRHVLGPVWIAQSTHQLSRGFTVGGERAAV